MAKKDDIFETAVNVRTFHEARRMLKRVLADLEANPGLRFQGKMVSQDALISASWMWLEELGPEVVAKGLARHLAHLDRIARSRKAAAELPRADAPDDEGPQGDTPESVRWLGSRNETEADVRREQERERRQAGSASEADAKGDDERAEGGTRPSRV